MLSYWYTKIKKVERQNRRQENAYRKKRKEKKRKEKKSKGLFYLIFTLTIIAALTISCKNKPTGTNEFAWEDETVTIPNAGTTEAPKYEVKEENWSTFINKTIITKDKFAQDGGEIAKNYHFWAEFSATGMKYAISEEYDEYSVGRPNYNDEVFLTPSAISGNTAKFDRGKKGQEGTIEFTVNPTTGVIENIKVTFTDGVGDSPPLKAGVNCKFIKETKL